MTICFISSVINALLLIDLIHILNFVSTTHDVGQEITLLLYNSINIIFLD